MSQTRAVVLTPTAQRGQSRRRAAREQARRDREAELAERTLLSGAERARPRTRLTLTVLAVLVLAFLAIIAVGPVLWLAKSAVSTTSDIVTQPFALWPSGIQWENLAEAWTGIDIGQYLFNTVWVAAGNWFFGLLVALTGGYVLAILRPRYAKFLEGAVMATLFIPGVVSLVSLYLTILSLPLIQVNLINTYWAVWLPASAHAFNVLLMRNFFAQLPAEVFEAAKVDGAGSFTVFWRIVLPMSRPIIGVVSLLTLVGAWKEFMWPLLVLPDPKLQPLSVGLYKVSATTEISLLMAGMFISVIVPIVLFLVFQRQFLRSAGQSGAIKG
ncbi:MULTISPECIES: carbohydrate ABC transporter permease [unclassified Microbacterium]|uniref:carbohydrate ABC transporter permease n=1 Tax=unclassified Microbacterium TaxID=2609290 RepID=UPI0012F79089|nr:carbohydrate ABC transporter permease [Microbacterium sp. MAH-37]MVQ41259.1 ABC transporter permease subunit [Microbacterium sp. MAH-37]